MWCTSSSNQRAGLGLGLLATLVLSGCAGRSLPPEALPPRLVPLSGTLNTRDLGGYLTADGQRVKLGRVYRSDQLSALDEKDVARLAELDLRTVYDLRTDIERDGEPNRLPPQTREERLVISHPSMDPQQLLRRILRGHASSDYFKTMLTRANRSFALEHGPELAELVRDLARPGTLPALFHCTYGKDRTGFASAMILDLLGVPWETVMQDYLLSNAYLEKEINQVSRLIWFASLFRISRASASDLLGVQADYLDSARQAIIDEYGSPQAYFRAIGVDDETIEVLRGELLEPAPPVEDPPE